MKSLRRALLATLITAVAAVTVGGGVATYRIVRREIGDALDYQLRLIALSLRDRALGLPRPSPPGEGELELVIQIWDGDGVRLYASSLVSDLPGPPARPGLGTAVTGAGAWRIFAVSVGAQVLQVAQPEAVRSRLAFAAASRTLAPLLVLLPALALLVWWIVGRGLSPLDRLARQAERRSATSLAPFPEEGAPDEVRPLVHSLNGLMARLSAALESQRAFVADAAHELRTPLAVLKLQASLASRAEDEAGRRAAIGDLERGLERTERVVQQLLTLARQEPGGERPRPTASEEVSLEELLAQAVADHAPLAEARGIDLGAGSSDARAFVRGEAESLRVLAANLVDNALRYTPAGGKVDVACGLEEGRPFLEVRDTGPGIPLADRERVFDRFFRRPGTGETGSGLGLAVVKAIARRQGARVTLDDNPGGGLRARVVWPRERPATEPQPGFDPLRSP